VPLVVVNMIPNNRSGESNQDSEPNITVDPGDPLRIAGSAFTPNLASNPNAPIYVSTDGGTTWALASIVPSQHPVVGTGDITVRFAASGTLYAGILRRPSAELRLNILRSPNFTSGVAMTVLVDRTPPAGRPDQPWVQAMTGLGGGGSGFDHVYVGSNDRPGPAAAPVGRTATVDRSLAGVGATPPPPSNFTINRVETRGTAWFSGIPAQDAPPVRPAAHPDGTVYVVFCAPRSTTGSSTLVCDIVVVRDDNWASGATPFAALTDPTDSLAGRLVMTGRNVPWFTYMGQERLGPNIAIAVDPRNSSNVYIAWADLTAGSSTTIHVRRSTDRGVTWSGSDLRAVTNATNVGLAVNSRGKVGLLYQQLTGTGSSQRWVTHLELTTNDWASAATDFVLATVPSGVPAAMFDPYIGDYANLVSLGKDFYGIFSANNTPNNANFPNGVSYQRNANFGTQTLLGTDGTTTVPTSIDPFFVKFTEIVADSDFYVRDWTDSPSSGDNGVEPSTHPVFYLTSDVWNRRKNTPGGFNANDQPQNEYPKMGPANAGRNFGFCRIRRNASGSAATVSAHFLVSPFGTGSPYQNADTNPDLSVPFAAGDLVKTPSSGYEWHIGPTMTDHLCFAVEITGPADPIASPSLLGHTPGWPTTDLMVLNDNNKAQRNMYPPASSGSGASSYYALVRNGATFRRDLVLDYWIDPRVLKQLGKVAIGVVGERGAKRASEGRFVLAGMEPGERRWISVSIEARPGTGRTPLPILFEEVVGNAVVNGFAIAPVPSPLGAAIRSNVELHAFRFLRTAAVFGIGEGRRQSADARKLLAQKTIAGTVYLRFLREHLEGMGACVGGLTSKAGEDPFALKAALARVKKAAGEGSAERAVPAHATFLEALDALLTKLQLDAGDPACVLHNVEWQRELYAHVKELAQLDGAKALVKASDEFARGFESRKFGPEGFPRHVKGVLPALHETATALPRLRLGPAIDRLERSLDSPGSAQRAHREVLLSLSRLRTSGNGGPR
jgi:hypothetical protein